MSKLISLFVITNLFLINSILPMERPQSGQPNSKRTRTGSTAAVMSDADKELLSAAVGGDCAAVEKALDADPNINVRDALGRTPLFLAAAAGHHEAVSLLLARGAYKEPVTKKGATPLYKAARYAREKVVKILLQAGADTDVAYGKHGHTPLHVAAREGHLEVVRLLLDHDADINVQNREGWSPLHMAARNRYLEVVRLLLDCGASISLEDDNDEDVLPKAGCKKDNETPETLEAQESIIELLLARCVHETHCMGKRNEFFQEDLYEAIKAGQEVLVRSLLDQGVDSNGHDYSQFRNSFLMIAAGQGYINIVRLLLDYGADPNALNIMRDCALEMACSKGHHEIAKLLINYGAVPGMTILEGYKNRGIIAAIDEAAILGRVDAVREGLEKDDAREKIQEVLAYAVGCGRPEVVTLLLQEGADGTEELLGIVELILARTLELPVRERYEAVHTLLLKHIELMRERETRLLPLKERIIRDFRHALLMSPHFSALPEELQERIASPEDQLRWAIHTWDENRIQEALNLHADVNASDTTSHDNSVLTWAVLYNLDHNVLRLLLNHGADPNVKIDGKQTLVEWAAAQNNADLVRLLLLYGADAEERVIRTHLQGGLVPEAALGRSGVVQSLLAGQPNIFELEEALLYAAGRGHDEVVDVLLDQEIPTQSALEVVRAIRSRGLSDGIARRYYLIERMLTGAQDVPQVGSTLEVPQSLIGTLMTDSQV